MSTTSLPAVRPVAVPRFAPIAAAWFTELLEVLHLARRIHTGSRARMRRLTEAAAVRNYADQIYEQDPRFAADLYAAADRHIGE